LPVADSDPATDDTTAEELSFAGAVL